MSTSKLIAGLLGPTLIVSAISVIANLGAWPALVEDAARSPALIMIAGYIAFAPGLAIVYFHNRWTFGWPVLVTVMGWILLLGGVLPDRLPDAGGRTRHAHAFGGAGDIPRSRGRLAAGRRIPFLQVVQAALNGWRVRCGLHV